MTTRADFLKGAAERAGIDLVPPKIKGPLLSVSDRNEPLPCRSCSRATRWREDGKPRCLPCIAGYRSEVETMPASAAPPRLGGRPSPTGTLTQPEQDLRPGEPW